MAGFFPDEFIQEVIAANDIYDVVSSYVRLKRSGSSAVGLCPFHNEKTPSFHVSADKQLYHCFGCGVGGTVLNFIMQVENLEFVDAVQFLAQRAGIPIPEERFAQRDKKAYERKKKMLDMNKDAARFFYSHVTEASAYLTKRGLDEKTVKTFGIGYAADGLLDYLAEKGYEKSLMHEAGLAGLTDSGRFYPKFRQRLMFPIIDLRHNVIGFGGRLVEDVPNAPKYLNSPESSVFRKGFNLYNLNLAKNAPGRKLILAEGYMDVVSLYKHGVTNAIASLGTSLTEGQAKLISNYADEVYICYDTDQAGRKATMRAIDIFKSTPVKVKVVNLPQGKDPDEFIKANGAQRFFQVLEGTKTALSYQINLLYQQYDLEDMNQKIAFVSEAARLLAKVESNIEREVYIKKITEVSGVSGDAINAEIKKLSRKTQRKEAYAQMKAGVSQTPVKVEENVRISPHVLKAERLLLMLLATDKAVYKALSGQIPSDLFVYELHAQVFQSIAGCYEGGTAPSLTGLISAYDPQQAGRITQIFAETHDFEDNVAAAQDALYTLEIERLDRMIAEYAKANDMVHLNECMKLKAQKNAERRA